MSQNYVSFDRDIKSLFTKVDRDHMDFMFDLWSYNDVKKNADDVLDAVAGGRMPPPPPRGEGPWSPDKIDLFKRWMDGGCQP